LPQRWLVIGLAAGVFVNIGLQLLNPQILRYFIDTSIDTSGSMVMLAFSAAISLHFSLL